MKLAVRVSPVATGDLIPSLLHSSADEVRISSRPRFDWREIGIVTDQRKPIVAGNDTVGTIIQSAYAHAAPDRGITFAYKNLDRPEPSRETIGSLAPVIFTT